MRRYCLIVLGRAASWYGSSRFAAFVASHVRNVQLLDKAAAILDQARTSEFTMASDPIGKYARAGAALSVVEARELKRICEITKVVCKNSIKRAVSQSEGRACLQCRWDPHSSVD